jgi:hypothetical protein
MVTMMTPPPSPYADTIPSPPPFAIRAATQRAVRAERLINAASAALRASDSKSCATYLAGAAHMLDVDLTDLDADDALRALRYALKGSK